MGLEAAWRSGNRTLTREEYYRCNEAAHQSEPDGGRRLLERIAVETSQAWRAHAACKGKPVEWWFPDYNQHTGALARRARAICATCPVTEPCRAFAEQHNERGIWGETLTATRVAARRKEKPEKRRPLGPLAAALMEVLADGHWHDHDDLLGKVEHLIADEDAARRVNQLRVSQGRVRLEVGEMMKSTLRAGRRLAVISALQNLAKSGRVDKARGCARMVPSQDAP